MLATSATLFVRTAAFPEISVIEIHGELNAEVEKQLLNAYARAQGPSVRTVLLDFTEMVYMNSSGIGLLITLLVQANREGQILAACGLSPHFEHIFKLTRLDEAIPLYSSQSEALDALYNV
jgi:anti-sigma B factor antagonist